MKDIKLYLAVAVLGVALGAISGLVPMGASGPEGIDLSGKSHAERLKKLDTQRIKGIGFLNDGNYEAAAALFLSLIQINHFDQFSYRQLGWAAKQLGEEKFVKLISDNVSDKIIGDTKDRVLGAAFYHAPNKDAAGRWTEAYLKENPGDLVATYYKGALTREAGDNRKAIELLTFVIEKEPSYYFAYLELEKAYGAAGELEMALKMSQLAFKNSPTMNKKGVCCGLPEPAKEENKEGSDTAKEKQDA